MFDTKNMSWSASYVADSGPWKPMTLRMKRAGDDAIPVANPSAADAVSRRGVPRSECRWSIVQAATRTTAHAAAARRAVRWNRAEVMRSPQRVEVRRDVPRIRRRQADVRHGRERIH